MHLGPAGDPRNNDGLMMSRLGPCHNLLVDELYVYAYQGRLGAVNYVQ